MIRLLKSLPPRTLLTLIPLLPIILAPRPYSILPPLRLQTFLPLPPLSLLPSGRFPPGLNLRSEDLENVNNGFFDFYPTSMTFTFPSPPPSRIATVFPPPLSSLRFGDPSIFTCNSGTSLPRLSCLGICPLLIPVCFHSGSPNPHSSRLHICIITA